MGSRRRFAGLSAAPRPADNAAMQDPATAAIAAYLDQSREALAAACADAAFLATCARIVDRLVACLEGGGKVLLAGNGGSAGDAQHIAGEFLCRLNYDRAPIAAVALTTDSSTLTAIGNDYGYEQTFSRQVAAWIRPGDVAVGISTSGNSANVVAAMQKAREGGATTIGLTGAGGGKMRAVADVLLEVPSRDTPRIQECHILIGHALCQAIEEALFGA